MSSLWLTIFLSQPKEASSSLSRALLLSLPYRCGPQNLNFSVTHPMAKSGLSIIHVVSREELLMSPSEGTSTDHHVKCFLCITSSGDFISGKSMSPDDSQTGREHNRSLPDTLRDPGSSASTLAHQVLRHCTRAPRQKSNKTSWEIPTPEGISLHLRVGSQWGCDTRPSPLLYFHSMLLALCTLLWAFLNFHSLHYFKQSLCAVFTHQRDKFKNKVARYGGTHL